MDWYSVDRRLAPLFRGSAHQAGAGFWVAAKEPIVLAALLDAALDEDEREELEGTFGEWPGNLGTAIEGTDARQENVLSAFWWGAGPGLSSGFDLHVVGTDTRSYLSYSTDFMFDTEGPRAVACLQPGFDEKVVRDAVEHVLLSNGAGVGLTLFWGSPPSEFSTVASNDVVRRAFELVRDKYDELGEWAEYVEAGDFR
jgi:hypothetical protein